MSDEKRIVEINGVKVEVDLRKARNVDTYRVGDNVRVLVKQYDNQYKVFSGVIISFDNFKELPTIVITYIDATYSDASMKTVFINSSSTDVDIAPACDDDVLFDSQRVRDILQREIEKAQNSLHEAKAKLAYFKRWENRLRSETQLATESPE